MTGGVSVFLIYLIAMLVIGVFSIFYVTLNLLVKLAIELIRTAVVSMLHRATALTNTQENQPC